MPSLTSLREVDDLVAMPPILRPVQWRFTITQLALANPRHTLASLKSADRIAFVASHAMRMAKLRKSGSYIKEKVRLDPEEVERVKYAYYIFEQPHLRSARYAIEAMFLTGEDMAKLAAEVGLSKNLLSTFGALFYDVEQFLDDKNLIYTYVMPQAYNRGHLGDSCDVGWKTAAVEHGLDGLRRAIHGKPTQMELNKMFMRQLLRILEMSDGMLHAGYRNLGEQELAVLAAGREMWKLSLSSNMHLQDARVASFETFFNEVAVIVDKALTEAVPLPGKTSAYLPPVCEPLLLTN